VFIVPAGVPPRPKVGKIVANKMLRAMRHVVRHGPDKDRISLHGPLRKWFEEKPSEFLSKLARMEAEQTARLPRFASSVDLAKESSPAVEDDGTDRARGQLDRALEEFNAR
jgi:hypothetical protein